MAQLLRRLQSTAPEVSRAGASKIQDGNRSVDPRTNLPLVSIPANKKKHYPNMEGAILHHFGEVGKFNAKGKVQNRVLILTNNLLFLCGDDGDVKRCIPINSIADMTLDNTNQVIVLRVPQKQESNGKSTSWDIMIQCAANPVVDIIKATYKYIKGTDLPITEANGRLTSACIGKNVFLERPQNADDTPQTISAMDEIEEWETVTKKLEDTTSQLRQKEAMLSDESGKLVEARQKIAEQDTHIDKLNTDVKNLEKVRDDQSKEITSLKHECEEKTVKIAKLEDKGQKDGEQINGMQKTVGELNQEIAQLKKQGEEDRACIGQLKQQIAQNEETIKKLNEKIQNIEKERDGLRADLKSKSDSLAIATLQLQEISARATLSNAHNEEMIKSVQQNSEQHKKALTKAMESQMAQLKAELSSLEEMKSQLQQMESLKSAKVSLEKEVERLTAENKSSKQNCEELTQTVGHQSSKMKELEASLQSLQGKISSKEGEADEIHRLKKSIEENGQKHNLELQKLQKSVEDQKAEMKHILSKHEEEKQQLIAKFTRSTEQFEIEKKSMQKHIEHLESKLSEGDEEVRQLRIELEKVKEELRLQLESPLPPGAADWATVKSLMDQLEKTKAALQQSDYQVHILKHKIQELQKQIKR